MMKPRLSASLILCREQHNQPWEVLMIKRKSSMAFSNSLVFPGGSLDPEDTSPEWHDILGCSTESVPSTYYSEKIDLTSLRIAAIRETWEETGVLLTKTPGKPPASKHFLETCKNHSLTPSIEKLYYLTRIIAPLIERKRFDATFFISIEGEQDIVVDNIESDCFFWGTPEHFLSEFLSNHVRLWPPQVYILKKLSMFRNLNEVFNGIHNFVRVPFLFQLQELYENKISCVLPGDYRHDLTPQGIKDKRLEHSVTSDGERISVVESPGLIDFYSTFFN